MLNLPKNYQNNFTQEKTYDYSYKKKWKNGTTRYF